MKKPLFGSFRVLALAGMLVLLTGCPFGPSQEVATLEVKTESSDKLSVKPYYLSKGLAVQVDLSGVTDLPKSGSVVISAAVTGTAASVSETRSADMLPANPYVTLGMATATLEGLSANSKLVVTVFQKESKYLLRKSEAVPSKDGEKSSSGSTGSTSPVSFNDKTLAVGSKSVDVPMTTVSGKSQNVVTGLTGFETFVVTLSNGSTKSITVATGHSTGSVNVLDTIATGSTSIEIPTLTATQSTNTLELPASPAASGSSSSGSTSSGGITWNQ